MIKFKHTQDDKLTFFDKVINTFNDYKLSINWTSTLVYYVIFVIALMIGDWSLLKILFLTFIFFIATLGAWLNNISMRK